MTDDDTTDRLDRLESLVERQAETIAALRDEVVELRHDEDEGAGRDAPVSRRTALRAGGLLALLGIGAGTASADPQGQVGTATDPLTALYTEELNGGVTGDTELTDLVGSGLTINSGALEATGTSAWADGDGDDLLEPVSPFTGIEVSDVRASTLADTGGNSHLTLNDGGPLDVNQLLDVDDNAIQSSSGNALTFHTDGGERTLELGVPSSDGPFTAGGNVVAGHPNNAVNNDAVGVVIGGGGANNGNENSVGGNYATVGGGFDNTASGFGATVGGGFGNEASGNQSTVGGGIGNVANSTRATVLGGRDNTASGDYSVAGGYFASTNGHDSSIVLSARSTSHTEASASGQFVVGAEGGVYLGDDTGPSGDFNTDESKFVETSTGAYLSTGGTWTDSSSRTVKEGIDPVDGTTILDRVASLPVSEWSYEAEPDDVRHLGPMAEDFHDAFGLGADDEHVASLDTAGVALAAIKGLLDRVRRLESRLEAVAEPGEEETTRA